MLKFLICIKAPSNAFITLLSDLLKKEPSPLAGMSDLRYCQFEQTIEAALPLRMINTSHPKDLFISFWQDTHELAPQLLNLLKTNSEAFQEYLCLENTPLTFQSNEVGLQPHYHQVALLKRPENLTQEQWLDTWINSHTQIAIETQSTFIYIQNICTSIQPRGDWPLMDAIVEEGFPLEACSDREVFFDAKGNPELKTEHEQEMIASCLRFIDFENFDCLPTQQTIIK